MHHLVQSDSKRPACRGASAGLVILAVLLLSASSYLSIPMVPVPITMQTLVVTLAGGLLGWRLGLLSVVLWLLLGALGAPVLSNGSAGFERFVGPSAGYLFAFPLAAVLTGMFSSQLRAGLSAPLWKITGIMLLGNAVCLALGSAWLGVAFNAEIAVSKGLLPFIPGAILKSIAAAMIWKLLYRYTEPWTLSSNTE
ncbi:MAG: biotin transporter BioY [Pigmentiphaga sp.]